MQARRFRQFRFSILALLMLSGLHPETGHASIKPKITPGKFIRPDGAMVLVFPENVEKAQLATTLEVVELKSKSNKDLHEFFSIVTHYLVRGDETRIISMSLDMNMDGLTDHTIDTLKSDAPEDIRHVLEDNILEPLSQNIRFRYLVDPEDPGDYDGSDGARLRIAEFLSFGFSSSRENRIHAREALSRGNFFSIVASQEKNTEKRRLLNAYGERLQKGIEATVMGGGAMTAKWAITDGVFFVMPVGWVAKGLKNGAKLAAETVGRSVKFLMPEKLAATALIRTLSQSGKTVAKVLARMDSVKIFPRFFARHWSGTLKTPGFIARQFAKTPMGKWLEAKAVAKALALEAETSAKALGTATSRSIFSKEFFKKYGFSIGYIGASFGLHLKAEHDYCPDEFFKSQRFYITAGGALAASLSLGFMAGRPLLKSMTINGLVGAGSIAGSEALVKMGMPDRKYAGIMATYFTTISPVKTQINRGVTMIVMELADEIPTLAGPYGRYVSAIAKTIAKAGGWVTIQYFDNSLGPKIVIFMQKESGVAKTNEDLETLTKEAAMKIQTELVEKHAARYLKMIEFVDKDAEKNRGGKDSYTVSELEAMSTKPFNEMVDQMDEDELEAHNEFLMSKGMDPLVKSGALESVEGSQQPLSNVLLEQAAQADNPNTIWLP